MKSPTLNALLCWILLLASPALAVNSIDPADPDLLYTGRWDQSSPSQPWCYWIGASLIAEFEGTSIEATMSGGYWNDSDYLRIIVDDDAAGAVKIALPTGVATYTLATGLSDGLHKIEIVKETDVGYWTIYALGLDDGRELMPPPARPSRRISFYGDSNLAGYSLASERNESGYHLRGGYNGYAGIVSRMLDAEYENVSRSGATISDIHNRYGRIDYWSGTSTWDFARFPADLVVVGLGANDLGRPKQVIKNDYHAFLDDLRASYPNAHIMLYNGWGWDYDEPANYTHEVIAERDDEQISFAIFPWIFEQWHGCEYDHAGMATLLADHLATTLGWSAGPADIMNGYALNGDLANGGFEEVAPFGGHGWRYFDDPGVSRVEDMAGAFEGSHYLRLSGGAASHQPFPALGGDSATLQLWMRGGEGDQVNVTLDFRDQKMWTPPLQTQTETMTLGAGWQQYSMTATAPIGGAHPVFHGRVSFEAAAGDVVEIDGVVLSSATGTPDSPPAPAEPALTLSPNPFNPRVSITFSLAESCQVALSVHEVSGRRVATLAKGFYAAGSHRMSWDGHDVEGRELGSGVYIARLTAGELLASRKMVLVR